MDKMFDLDIQVQYAGMPEDSIPEYTGTLFCTLTCSGCSGSCWFC